MSTPLPPPTPPPGNYSAPPGNSSPPPGNYYPPPVPPKSGSAGCWKAAGLTCGVLFLLVLIGGVLLVRFGKQQYEHPTRGSILGTTFMAGRAMQDGLKLQRAIVEYQAAHGHYPNTLLDLVREGRIDGKLLHNDLDPKPSVGSISWEYIKPGPGAPGSTTLLTEHYFLDIPGARGASGASAITITLDGHTGSTTGGASRTTFGKPPTAP